MSSIHKYQSTATFAAFILFCQTIGAQEPRVWIEGIRTPSQAAIDADPTLETVMIYDIFTSTPGDILSIEGFMLTLDDSSDSSFFYHISPPLGSEIHDNCPTFCLLAPYLEADSYVTTPGPTSCLINIGSECVFAWDGIYWATFSDFTDEGPQDRFQFARLALGGNGHVGTFTGSVVYVDPHSSSVSSIPFDLTLQVPEPTAWVSGLILMATLPTFCRRKSPRMTLPRMREDSMRPDLCGRKSTR